MAIRRWPSRGTITLPPTQMQQHRCIVVPLVRSCLRVYVGGRNDRDHARSRPLCLSPSCARRPIKRENGGVWRRWRIPKWRARRDSNATHTVGARLTDHGGGVTKSCSPGLWAGGPGEGTLAFVRCPFVPPLRRWAGDAGQRRGQPTKQRPPFRASRNGGATWSPRRDAAAAVEKSSRLMLARCPTP